MLWTAALPRLAFPARTVWWNASRCARNVTSAAVDIEPPSCTDRLTNAVAFGATSPGTEPKTAIESGIHNSESPKPANITGTASVQNGDSLVVTSPSHQYEIASRMKPIPTMRTTTMTQTAVTSARQKISIPLNVAVYPKIDWTYCGKKTIAP